MYFVDENPCVCEQSIIITLAFLHHRMLEDKAKVGQVIRMIFLRSCHGIEDFGLVMWLLVIAFRKFKSSQFDYA
jgi:hypothetical protein